MHPLLVIFLFILALFLFLVAASFVISVLVTSGGIWFLDRTSKKNAAVIYELLPKTDCGQCGCGTCKEYALLIADSREEQGRCPAISQGAKEQIAEMFFAAETAKKPGRKSRFKK